MDRKNKKPLSSQIVGIVWLSVGLLFVLGVAFFSSRTGRDRQKEDTVTALNQIKLAHQEDSVCRNGWQRREYHDYKRYSDRKTATEGNTKVQVAAVPPYTRKPLTVELNGADTTTLMLLHGIGPVFAKRIVRYRERLGGFVDVRQLLEIYGFTPEMLNSVAPYITVDTGVIVKMPVNSIPLKQFIKHPYIEYYQARDIVTLRGHGVCFHSADDLRTVPSMSDSTLCRLLPYLDFAQ